MACWRANENTLGQALPRFVEIHVYFNLFHYNQNSIGKPRSNGMFEYVLIPRFLVLLSNPNTRLSAEAGRLWNRKPVQEKVAFCYMFASVAQCDTHLEGVANPSPSKVQCAFKSLGIALRGIPRHVISKKKNQTGFWRRQKYG